MEIERKFLVKDDSWKSEILKSERILQFYLTDENQIPTLRLRLKEATGILTIKYPSTSSSILIREEFEYEIPVKDVLAQQKSAKGQVIQKTRHHVSGPGNLVWEVDVFESPKAGLVLAEIELNNADDRIILPKWIGEEVTSDAAYSNIKMAFLDSKPT